MAGPKPKIRKEISEAALRGVCDRTILELEGIRERLGEVGMYRTRHKISKALFEILLELPEKINKSPRQTAKKLRRS